MTGLSYPRHWMPREGRLESSRLMRLKSQVHHSYRIREMLLLSCAGRPKPIVFFDADLAQRLSIRDVDGAARRTTRKRQHVPADTAEHSPQQRRAHPLRTKAVLKRFGY